MHYQEENISMQREFKNMFEAINIEDLPPGADNFINMEDYKYSFYDDLYTLKWILWDELTVQGKLTPKQRYFSHVFLAFVNYFLIDKDAKHAGYCLTHIDEILVGDYAELVTSARCQVINKLLVHLKYRIKSIPDVIILVDKEYDEDVFFKSMRFELFRSVQVRFIETFSSELFQDCLSRFDQVMLIAHGDETGTYFSEFQITSDWLVSQLQSFAHPVAALGIFSCQENWSTSAAKEYVDYFITDSISSNPQFNEIFLCAFLQSYFKTGLMVDAFNIASLGPLFRASSDVRFEMFERGFKVRNYWNLM